MGFYIEKCQKMSYKSQYSPAFLLNAQHSKWIPFEECEDAVAAGEFDFHIEPHQRICLGWLH